MESENVIAKATRYATQAHARIDQRRKYTSQSVDVHLKAVAGIVASVTDDEEMIAAAWLHDTVEDTQATLDDIEREFGRDVRTLVAELTDVSRPSDGNRAVRKAIDREHLAGSSPRAQTIKLADLIDNCPDICKHEPRFGRVYLREMDALLDVLGEGDPRLRSRARRLHEKWTVKLGPASDPSETEIDDASEFDAELGTSETLHRFAGVFAARDIAEPLRSFDRARPLDDVAAVMEEDRLLVVGVRDRGCVVGYLRAENVRSGGVSCGDAERGFAASQVVDGSVPLSAVIQVLTLHEACFVHVLGSPHGVITRADIQKPIVRMWLFGIITFFEMRLDERIRELWSEEEWTAKLSKGRVDKAWELLGERARRGEVCRLIDCLQLADRAQILMEDVAQQKAFGFSSKSAAQRVMKDIQSLRNKLAHAQDIVTHDWAPIARLARRIETIAP